MNKEQPSFQQLPESERSLIQELRLTNVEWMRYRLNGELPKQAQEIQKRKEEIQTQSDGEMQKGVDVSHQDDVVVSGGQHGWEAMEANKEVYEREASRLLRDVEESLVGEIDLDKFLACAQRVKDRFLLFYDLELLSDESDEYQKQVDGYISRISSVLRDVILQEQRPVSQSAAFARGLLQLNSVFSNEELKATTYIIQEKIQKEEFEFIGSIMGYDIDTSREVFIMLEESHKQTYFSEQSDEFIEQLVANLTGPIISYVREVVEQSGLQSGFYELHYIKRIIKELKLNRTRETQEAVQRLGCSFQGVADTLFQVYYDKRQEIQGGYPSHTMCQYIMETIKWLYKEDQLGPYEVPQELSELLHVIYREKVIPYSIGGEPGYLHGDVKGLCDEFGLNIERVQRG